MDLVRKVGLMGTRDLRKLAPIGDIGYLNGIEFYRGDFVRSTLPSMIMMALSSQMEQHKWEIDCVSSNWRHTDNRYRVPAIGLYYSVDSSD